jgi:hypothetical protein
VAVAQLGDNKFLELFPYLGAAHAQQGDIMHVLHPMQYIEA